MVFLDHVEDVGRNEFVEVVDKNIGAGYPLAVEFSPYGFPPTGVGKGEVQAFLIEVVPVRAGNDVSQRIGKVMGDHFGVACRAGCEIKQRRIIVGIGQCRTLERCSGFNACVEIEPAFGYFGADRYAVFQCG